MASIGSIERARRIQLKRNAPTGPRLKARNPQRTRNVVFRRNISGPFHFLDGVTLGQLGKVLASCCGGYPRLQKQAGEVSRKRNAP